MIAKTPAPPLTKRPEIPMMEVSVAEIVRLREIAKAAQRLDLYLHRAPHGFAALVPSACRENWNRVAQNYWPAAHWRLPIKPIEETRFERLQRYALAGMVGVFLVYLTADSEFGRTLVGLIRIEVLGW